MVAGFCQRVRHRCLPLHGARGTHGKTCLLCHSRQGVTKFQGAQAYKNISLADQLKECIDNQVHSGRYSSVSEYVRDLIRDDEKRKAQEEREAMS